MSLKIIVFLFFLAEVTPWTIDLPEIRKFVFEKYENDKRNQNDDVVVNDGIKFYSNIEGNSQHNADPRDEEKNLVHDGYGSYMEKKVFGTVLNGSRYLEGLRRSLEQYGRYLDSCNNRNGTMRINTTWQFPVEFPPQPNFTMPSPPFNFSVTPPTSPPFNSSESNLPLFDATTVSCEEVNKRSEHVRRLSELATWSTRRLQDLAYARRYQKVDVYEENELILKLAWFLDRLAYLTGFEPRTEEFLPSTTIKPTTVSPTVPTLFPVPDSVKTAMMDCIKENSSVPATERCRFPLPLPDIVRQMLNITDVNGTDTAASTDSTNVIPMTENTAQESEILVTSEDRQFNLARTKRSIEDISEIIRNPTPAVLINKLSNRREQIVKSINNLSYSLSQSPIVRIFNRLAERRKILQSNPPIIAIKKRSIDSPVNKLVNYYYKYKVWEGANSMKNYNNDFQPYDVHNHLVQKHIEKRSLHEIEQKIHKIEQKKHRILTPLRNIKHFIKNRQRIHYNTYVIQKPKIISHLETIRHQINNNKIGKVELKTKSKRSVHYQNMYLPRVPTDPQGDISYYVKNKEGREYNPSLVQAAQLRLGLEQIFQTGNIEVVRRFGSNYNPLDPAPFYTGILRTMADS